MTDPHIGACLQRVSDVLERRPSAAVQEDSPAVAVWDGALGTRLAPATGMALGSDMPVALGGKGTAPTPGWYVRAGVASCLVTSIAIQAAMRGIALRHVEVQARSRSDARGLLGIAAGVPPGPLSVSLTVTVQAPDVPQEALRALVEAAQAHAPMSDALRRPINVELDLQACPCEP